MAYSYEQVKKAAEDKGLLPGCKARFIGAMLGRHPDQPNLIISDAKEHVKKCPQCRAAKRVLSPC